MKLYTMLSLLFVLGCSPQMSKAFDPPLGDLLIETPEGIQPYHSTQRTYQELYQPLRTHTIIMPDGQAMYLHHI